MTLREELEGLDPMVKTRLALPRKRRPASITPRRQTGARAPDAGDAGDAPDAGLPGLVRALARSLNAQVIETHISWVLLTDDQAYKLKKPVHLPFVDYSTVEARRHFCAEEVRLNERLAPSLYQGVTRITGTLSAPALEGTGPVLEYAVQMRRFPDGALFCEQLEAATLRADQVDRLVELLADFHLRAPRRSASDQGGGPTPRRASALAALDGVGALAIDAEAAALRAWIEAESAALAPLWETRDKDGHVRECHGDLHLGNVVSLDGDVAAFDCIEFSPALRWIDIVDDLSFIVMDFAAHGRAGFAFRFLNGWLDRTGDHAGLPALRFSVVYRALVRAQVESLRGPARDAVARRYLKIALAWAVPGKPGLSITHGLPGSGKTFGSQRLLEQEGAIRLRSDVERKRLFGLQIHEHSGAKGLQIYQAGDTARTYEYLLAMAGVALRAGYPVILDAAFLARPERARALELARSMRVPFSILTCHAPLPVLRARILGRVNDASEADVAVLERLHAVAEPLSGEEIGFAREMPGGVLP